MLRAALEGVAFALRDGLQALVDEEVATGSLRLVGGGVADDRWRTLLAAALGRPLHVHRTPQASVLGAARLAAAAVGGDLPAALDGQEQAVDDDALRDALDVAWLRWRARAPPN